MSNAKKLQQAMEQQQKRRKSSSAKKNEYRSYTNDEVLQEAYDNRISSSKSGGDAVLSANRRGLLLASRFDFLDARELNFNDMNHFTVDEGSVEALADLIMASGETQPIIVRMTDRGYEIVDGERRTRAHILLAERTGEERYYMIPARTYPLGTLSDDDVEFLLNAQNIGQRNIDPSERARGFASVSSRILEIRKDNPKYAGRATKEIVAEQLGVSPRTAAMEINIGNNLIDEGMQIYDRGLLTKQGADAIAQLDAEQQKNIVTQVNEGKLNKNDVIEEAAKMKGTTTKRIHIPKTPEQHIVSATRAAKRAFKAAKQQGFEEISAESIHELLKYVSLIKEERGRQLNIDTE